MCYSLVRFGLILGFFETFSCGIDLCLLIAKVSKLADKIGHLHIHDLIAIMESHDASLGLAVVTVHMIRAPARQITQIFEVFEKLKLRLIVIKTLILKLIIIDVLTLLTEIVISIIFI